ncbi:GLPGLI family protein [Porphyromonas gingivalis]|nr:GLPGLI family protein [Porphyromonas gingivalis]
MCLTGGKCRVVFVNFVHPQSLTASLMKKILSTVILFCILSSFGVAQVGVPRIDDMRGMRMDTVSKKIKDYAQRRFFYKVIFVEDTLKREKKTEAQCVLEIGRHGSSFMDLYQLAWDSLSDAVTRRKGSMMELFTEGAGLVKKIKWRIVLLKGYPEGTDRHQQEVPLTGRYEYECPSPSFDWQIGEETKEIMEYTCRKATCHHSGRDYTAWYAEDIALSDGPYIFRGLPGLIVAIASDDGEYAFELNGIQEEITFSSPIYLYDKKVQKYSREEVRKIVRNISENYSETIINQGRFRLKNPEDIQRIGNLSYNPLEKE